MKGQSKVWAVLIIGALLAFGALNILNKQEYTIIYKWVDGDTLVTTGGDRIRLADINCPELATDEGKEAKEYAEKTWPEGSIVIVKTKPSQPDGDMYGRRVAYVYPLIGESINNQLVLYGWAKYV